MKTKITCILVDDESNSRIVLRSLLKRYEKDIEVVGEAQNVDEAYDLIQKYNPQLVFLDIQMPRGDGFSLLGKFVNANLVPDKIPFEVIFVTSYDKYAINAIKFSALDYLLKPIEIKDLDNAISKAIDRVNDKKNTQPQIVNLLHTLSEETDEHKIAVHLADNVKLIDPKTILFIEADGSYCHIHTSNNESYITSKYLKDFEDYFGQHSVFVRINKSILLNTKYIERYTKGEPCIIEMSNGQNFEVSRRKKQEVLERIKL